MMAVDVVAEYVYLRGGEVQDLNRSKVMKVMDKVLCDECGKMASEYDGCLEAMTPHPGARAKTSQVRDFKRQLAVLLTLTRQDYDSITYQPTPLKKKLMEFDRRVFCIHWE